MKTKIALIAFFSFLTPPLFAQEAIVTSIQEGEEAPFDGTLMNPEAVAEILAQRESAAAECEARTENAVEECQTTLGYELQLAQSANTVLEQRYADMMDLKEQEIARLTEVITENTGSDHSVWWFTGGLVLGAGIVVGIVALVN